VLAGDYFSDTHLNLGDKDSYLQLQGRLLHEFSELHSLSGKDVTLVKAFLTSTTDYLRAPFDRRPAEYPRQCVFFGTSNNAKWARDRSGNRRFWPVEVAQPIDTDWVEANLDQLFAEAVHRVQAGERSYPTHEEERQWFIPEQAKRVQSTATEEALYQYLCGQRDSKGANKELVVPSQVTLISCLEGIGIDVAKSASNRMVQSEVIEMLHKWGWQHRRSSKQVNGARPWVYAIPAVWPPREEISEDDEVPESPQARAGITEDDDVPF
jgi:putative DNA primase/helicase